MKVKLSKILLSLLAWGLLCPVFGATGLRAEEPKTLDLSQGWSYRWGDSPFVEGKPLWTTETAPEGAWAPIEFPSNPPGREGRTNVWYRVQLPQDGSRYGNGLFIFSIDLIAEVYLEDRLIYRWGEFGPDGKGKFIGWPWHLVPLPGEFGGQWLYVRVFSDFPDIGLWGQVILGSEGEHIKRILRESAASTGVGLALVFSGLLCLTLAAYRLSLGTLLLGLLMANLGIESIESGLAKQLLFNAPLVWQYIGATNYFLIPVTLALLVKMRLGKGWFWINSNIAALHLLFVNVALAVSLAGWVNLSSMYIYFDSLAVFTVGILTAQVLLKAHRGERNDRILALGFVVLYFFWVFDGLTAHDILPWLPQLNYIGKIFLSFCLGLVLLREYNSLKNALKARSQQLSWLNQSLEDQVETRTKELQTGKLALEQQALALEEANQTKNKFFSILAHDLRGPVAGLAATFEAIEVGAMPTDSAMIGRLSKATLQLYEQLETILAWARSQMQLLERNPKSGPLAEVVAPVVELFAETAAQKRIDLVSQVGAECLIHADQDMVGTILRNLVGNALKFTQPGGKVWITARQEGHLLRVEVWDNGIGIRPERLGKLFDLGSGTGSTKGTNGETGVGLGLVLCKEFAEKNGGHLGADSKVGQGSCFWVTLPCFSEEAATDTARQPSA
ncbi:MAG: hypothetical protein A2600_11140 [Candidatus Lambdaproteobacteria bacterium RIFOXYD1_FULL_56_27]|uniref:histidine kinase n=1 Tax=Candidatus Lambdaproteobacteria bacterium RIFOXYD2_FULL_56_26 TaxID=1817773 RepID=A0A1F6GU75_9PROT|nr:MAG: hypothetical protein A2426_09180 [Candidatus Lambdaproteobacteria bacterium RIFOXYC1_FULL_56_13]OGH01715.1 MAG: hypothetical protein A2557_09065 [Candidatus Lambdaproteobacteria bacterium RIFOXYD2_FULL_56_26]OGH07600.1 MAG: hypothetical protein A2600_11140 [Candidatus Lambdaproteobacteria bacterium RIFOXYD1_FULL_56_27]